MSCLRRVIFVTLIFVHASRFIKTGLDVGEVLLVVGVLSAQNHSAARNAIRHTWKSFIGDNMKLYFVLGKDICPIHPIDRVSEHSCEELSIKWPVGLSFDHGQWTTDVLENSVANPSHSFVSSFTFRANFPVVVRGIRVLKTFIMSFNGVLVNLKNAQSGEVITSYQFDSGISPVDNVWIEKKTDSFLLPKMFDGELEIFPLSHLNGSGFEAKDFHCEKSSSWSDISGALHYTSQYGPKMGWIPFSYDSCVPISLELELYGLQQYLINKQSRSKQWTFEIEELSNRLTLEAYENDDILLVDVVDVYKNLPQKLLAFYNWAYRNLPFQFLLKADDDSFINIPLVEQYLLSKVSHEGMYQKETQSWWWGKLRYGLPVDRHGKWQELDYEAPVYPPFPCGGGYILNRNIVSFIVSNSDKFHSFQGEDTSLGIWLSGVRPLHPENASCQWSCDRSCRSVLCSKVQLSVTEMLDVWRLYGSQQVLCEEL